MTKLAQGAAGACAALLVPFHLRTARLNRLVAPAAHGPGAGPRPDFALRVARGVISRLARLRVPPYRNTCLFRSVAECLVLRWHGHPAVLRIGVRPDDGPSGIAAHAWVESAGAPVEAAAAPFEVLRGAPTRAARR